MKTQSISYTLKILTGLHIGGGNDKLQIGGIDNEVIKNPITKEPYIPGSSLKGKLRCLFAINKGINDLPDKTKKEDVQAEQDLLVPQKEDLKKLRTYFGYAADAKKETDEKNNLGFTRFLFRDLKLTEEWQEKFNDSRKKGLPFMEEKTEISIDRRTGTVGKSGPRQIERIPASVEFQGEIIIRHKDEQDLSDGAELLKEAFELLKNDALGGSGSRGYGQVEVDYSALDKFIKKDKTNESNS